MASGDGFTKPFIPRSAEWHFLQRQERRARRMGYAGHPIRVEQIAHRENLFRCWQKLAAEGGKGAGIDGFTYKDFTPSEVGQIVANLSEQVLSGAYFAEDVRKVRIPKKPDSDDYRTLKIGTLCDRVLGSAVNQAFRPLWEKRFLPSSYGFRPGMSTWRMLADLEVTMRRTGMHVLAVDDVRNAFDTVPIDEVVELHEQELSNLRQANFSHYDKARSLALIEAVLRGNDRKRERGIDQGNPYSPTALNVLLHNHHDVSMNKEHFKKLLWYRYADNLTYLCQNMSEGWQTLKRVSHLLQPLGLTLKEEDGVEDLTHGNTHLLGFSVWWAGKNLHLKVKPDVFDTLKQRLSKAHVTPNPPRTALEAVRGWMEAFAPAFEDGDVSHALTVIAECGFREGISLKIMRKWWQGAWSRWQRCRKRARRRYRERS